MRYLLVLLATAGVVVSAMALHVHYSKDYLTLPCDINSVWSCGLVNHSRYASILGVPVALIGILGYVLLGLLAWTWKRRATLGFAFIALGFALYLTNVEWHILGEWCLYCVSSQIIIAIFTVLAFFWFLACRLGWSKPSAKPSL